MKKIKLIFAALFTVALIMGITACATPSNSGNNGDGSGSGGSSEPADPFAGTSWYGDLYKGEYDEDMKIIYKKYDTGVLFSFRPESEKTFIMGQEYGYVEIPNDVYFLYPKDYEAAQKTGNENAYKLLKNQKITYTVEKNSEGYSACIGIFGEQFRLKISKADSKEGIIKWTAGGYITSGYGDNEVTWNFNDTLPRTIYKQEE